MKKLTWFFLSMMLCLGMGTAFAQDTDEPATPAKLPDLVATPANGTVSAGSTIEFTVPDEYRMMPVYLLYTINDESTTIDASFEELFSFEMGSEINGCKVALFQERGWLVPCVIPVDQEAGEVTLRARMFAFAFADESDEDADPNVVASDMAEFTYTVEATAPVVIPVPTFDPEGSEVEMNTSVSVECNEEPTEYTCMYLPYWVLDNEDFDFAQYETDVEVEAAGAKYSTIKITKETKVTAATAKIDMMEDKIVGWSEKVTMTYTVKAAVEEPSDVPAPVFNPDGGEVESGVKVILTNGTESEESPLPIYYNHKADGSAFASVTTQAQLETALKPGLFQKLIAYPEGGIELTADKAINAATAQIDAEGNITWSTVITRNFTIKTSEANELAAPTFTPDGGEVELEDGITLATTTTGADIYYAKGVKVADYFTQYETQEELDEAINNDLVGATPVLYESYDKPTAGFFEAAEGSSFSVSAAAVLVANDGSLTWSDVTVKEFTVKAAPAEPVAKPVITPANDAQARMGDKVTITCGTEGAKIYYTANGQTPYTTDKDGYPVEVMVDSAFVHEYTEAFELTEDMLIKQGSVWALKIRAIAVKDNVLSSGASVGYVVYPNAPIFSVEAGEVVAGTEVEITSVPSVADIYYTLDGSTPSMEESPRYTEPIEITEDMTIKAVVVLGQYQASGSATYTVVELDTLPAPVFSVAVGEVVKGTTVALSCDTADAKIYYSINADTVTVNSLEYTAAIAIDSNMTIRAIAVKEGFVNSAVATAAYTLKETSNDAKELAGVRIYPNPTEGNFKVEAPVAAKVEIFGMNGIIVKAFTMNAGVEEVRLANSGIYFVRLTAENGLATVKRVIVR